MARQKGAQGFTTSEMELFYEAVAKVRPKCKKDFDKVKEELDKALGCEGRSAHTLYNKYNSLTLTKATGAGESLNIKRFKELRANIEKEYEEICDEEQEDEQEEQEMETQPEKILSLQEGLTDGIESLSDTSNSSFLNSNYSPNKKRASQTSLAKSIEMLVEVKRAKLDEKSVVKYCTEGGERHLFCDREGGIFCKYCGKFVPI